jgi:hypothetical protein
MFQYGVVLEYRAYVKKELGQGVEEHVVNAWRKSWTFRESNQWIL